MQQHRQSAPPSAAQQLQPIGYSFSCACCNVMEVRPDREVPTGWVIEKVRDDTYVVCSDCAVYLPPVQQ